MSYAFNVKAANKAAAKEAVAAQFDQVVVMQPIHARDKDAVVANASAVIDLLRDDDTRDISVSLSGYVSWSAQGGETPEDFLNTAAVSATASYVVREEN